jgi:hypothetical protein
MREMAGGFNMPSSWQGETDIASVRMGSAIYFIEGKKEIRE